MVFTSFTTLLWFLLAISILVAVHEFGHFYVARRCGVKVLRFSIGFGRRLLTWVDARGTEFAISAIPLGGYVKMLDEREAPVAEHEKHLSFNAKSVWVRIAIALAGPLANFVLALLLYWLLFLQGTVDYSPVIGEVKPNSVAAEARLEVGQEIVAIDGVATATRRDVAVYLLNRLGESGEIRFTAKYPDSTINYESAAQLHDWLKGAHEPDVIAGIGIGFYAPALTRIIYEVLPDSAAAAAGMQAGDEVLAVDGEDIDSWEAWTDYLQARPGQEIVVTVARGERQLDLRLTPRRSVNAEGRVVGLAGVSTQRPPYPEEMVRRHHYGVAGALVEGGRETWQTAGFILLSLKKLVVGEISTKNLSGPIGIAKVAADHAQHGLWAFLSFLAHLSVVLGVLNLLPIPVLDGGHVLFCLVERVKGSPLSERAQMIGVQMGMAMILGIMVIAFYNDILRL